MVVDINAVLSIKGNLWCIFAIRFEGLRQDPHYTTAGGPLVRRLPKGKTPGIGPLLESFIPTPQKCA